MRNGFSVLLFIFRGNNFSLPPFHVSCVLHDFMSFGFEFLPLLLLFLGSGDTLEILPIARKLILSME